MTTEKNEVRIFGIKPAHDSDDIPIEQGDQADLQATGYLMAYYETTPEWLKVACDVNGKLIVV